MVDGRSLIDIAKDHHLYCKATYGARSMRTMDAFQALSQAYTKCGQRIDSLRMYIPDEWLRFESLLLPGLDGHVFWQYKSNEFSVNVNKNGKRSKMQPLYYWWRRIYGNGEDLQLRLRACDTQGCISPYHARKEDTRKNRERLYSDQAIIGALQVWGMRTGQAPTKHEWDRHKQVPSSTTVMKRFNGFENALLAAGLQPRRDVSKTMNPEEVLDGVRRAAEEVGEWPSFNRYRKISVGKYPSPQTVIKYFGSWNAAITEARAQFDLPL